MAEQTAAARVNALIKLGRFPEAATLAREGLVTSPNSVTLNVLLAVALCETGDCDGAVAAARRAVALQPENHVTLRTLGWSTGQAGRNDEAKRILTDALSINPDDPMTHLMLADVLVKQARGMPRRSLKGSQLLADVDRHGAEMIRLDPESADGYLVRSRASILAEDSNRASAWAHEAVKREPDNPATHQALGMSAQLQGDTTVAADHYVAAGRLDPRSSRSTELLKGLRKRAPIGVLLAFVLIRLISIPFRDGSGVVQGIGLGVVVAFLVFLYVVWPRWNARRSMSAEARQVLARDRQLR